jgi:hypothetical protein
MQWHRAKILDLDAPGQRDTPLQLIALAHRLIEDGGNDSTMRVSRRAGKAATQSEIADEAITALAKLKVQMQPMGILRPAAKAMFTLPGGSEVILGIVPGRHSSCSEIDSALSIQNRPISIQHVSPELLPMKI